MRARTITAAAAAAALLNGCWFVWIPGSAVRAISDSITGDEGQHCVSASVRVGDVVKLPYGGKGRVKSLSGESMMCGQLDKPIRALLEPI